MTQVEICRNQRPAQSRILWLLMSGEMLGQRPTYSKETAAEAMSADRPSTAATKQSKTSATLNSDHCIELICVTLSTLLGCCYVAWEGKRSGVSGSLISRSHPVFCISSNRWQHSAEVFSRVLKKEPTARCARRLGK